MGVEMKIAQKSNGDGIVKEVNSLLREARKNISTREFFIIKVRSEMALMLAHKVNHGFPKKIPEKVNEIKGRVIMAEVKSLLREARKNVQNGNSTKALDDIRSAKELAEGVNGLPKEIAEKVDGVFENEVVFLLAKARKSAIGKKLKLGAALLELKAAKILAANINHGLQEKASEEFDEIISDIQYISNGVRASSLRRQPSNSFTRQKTMADTEHQ